MTTEYTLLARDGDKVELGMKVVQTVAGPPGAVPGVPAEAQAALGAMQMEATGSGKMTTDLKSMVPASEMTTSTTMSMGAPAQGQAPGMSMAMQMTMATAPN